MRGWLGSRGETDMGDENGDLCICDCHERGFLTCPMCTVVHEVREIEHDCHHCGETYTEFHMCRDTQESES